MKNLQNIESTQISMGSSMVRLEIERKMPL